MQCNAMQCCWHCDNTCHTYCRTDCMHSTWHIPYTPDWNMWFTSPLHSTCDTYIQLVVHCPPVHHNSIHPPQAPPDQPPLASGSCSRRPPCFPLSHQHAGSSSSRCVGQWRFPSSKQRVITAAAGMTGQDPSESPCDMLGKLIRNASRMAGEGAAHSGHCVVQRLVGRSAA